MSGPGPIKPAEAQTASILAPFRRIQALSAPGDPAPTPELLAMTELVELGKMDITETDTLLLTARDKLQSALERDGLPARELVAVSAELRSIHDKLLAITARREKTRIDAWVKAKTRGTP